MDVKADGVSPIFVSPLMGRSPVVGTDVDATGYPSLKTFVEAWQRGSVDNERNAALSPPATPTLAPSSPQWSPEPSPQMAQSPLQLSLNAKSASETRVPVIAPPTATTTPRSQGRRLIQTELIEELMCPICLDAYHIPITIPCGHTFCRYCICRGGAAGRLCPLCRIPLGKNLSINMVLFNVIKAMGLVRTGVTISSPRGDASRLISKPAEGPLLGDIDETWWSAKLTKPCVPLVLFLRVLMLEFGGDVENLFFQDCISCVADYMEEKHLWGDNRWVCTVLEASKIAKFLKLNLTMKNAENLEKIQNWVEQYVERKPGVIAKNNCLEPFTPRVIFRVLVDKLHKVDGQEFDSNTATRLPWDIGRHATSQFAITHTSVSLSHFLVVPSIKSEVRDTRSSKKSKRDISTGLSIIDCGSTIGTMMKIRESPLHDLDCIHLGDHLEFTVHFDEHESSQYCWSNKLQKVLPSSAADSDCINIPTVSIRLCENGQAGQPIDGAVNPSDRLVLRPDGTAIGRGPNFSLPAVTKITITDTNGYVSREHCIIYFGKLSDKKPPQWVIKDTSSLGTFRKLVPYKDVVPVDFGSCFKAGQCRMDVARVKPKKAASESRSRSGVQQTILVDSLVGNNEVVPSLPDRNDQRGRHPGMLEASQCPMPRTASVSTQYRTLPPTVYRARTTGPQRRTVGWGITTDPPSIDPNSTTNFGYLSQQHGTYPDPRSLADTRVYSQENIRYLPCLQSTHHETATRSGQFEASFPQLGMLHAMPTCAARETYLPTSRVEPSRCVPSELSGGVLRATAAPITHRVRPCNIARSSFGVLRYPYSHRN